MGIKVLLVDDERIIVKNLQQVIPWHEMGMEVIGTARNGQEALSCAKRCMPDLVLCDIRMPVMDGIAFVRELRGLDESCEVVMLTGYSEFEYAQAAIRYRVRDYILKPIDYDSLKETVYQISQEIAARRQEFLKRSKENDRLSNLAYEKILYEVLMDYSSLNAYRYLLDGAEHDEHILILMDTHDYIQKGGLWDGKQRKLRNFAVKNVLQEVFQTLYPTLNYSVIMTRDGEWCVVIACNGELKQALLEDWNRLGPAAVQAIEENVKIRARHVMYSETVTLQQLSEAYKQLQKQLLFQSEREIGSAEAAGSAHGAVDQEQIWSWIEKLGSGIKASDHEQIDHAFAQLHQAVRSVRDTSSQSLRRMQQILHFLILHLMREMKEMDLISIEAEAQMWDRLARYATAAELVNFIHEFADECVQVNQNKSSTEMMMRQAKAFIDESLGRGIGIEEVAEHAGISSSYFSLLFKKKYGKTFVEYVTEQRMESAKLMLGKSGRSVADIGEAVGYPERRYFTKVFQKYTGMTPSEYRSSKQPIR